MESVVYFLLAAALAVTLFKKLGLGAILGYLAAGVVIGPQVLGLIDDPEKVLHFSEIGVILLLFVIGLELEPAKLWAMRAQVLLLGSGQLLITAGIIYGVLAFLFEMNGNAALMIALALGLSSTAFAIQLMADKGILGNEDGRRGFSMLLFQDLAVVPILFAVQALAPIEPDTDPGQWWLAPAAILGLIVFARYLINPALQFLSRYGGREIMTVVALLIVLGAAVVMEHANLSMGLGAFMAGLMLGLMLCQGGEFGFVIMAQAMDLRLLGEGTAGMVNLMIGISMALTAPVVLWFEKFTDKQIAKAPENIEKFDSSESEGLILGFGRFGQVTGRILAANQIHFTALDKNAEHIEFVKKFGNQVCYGDASRAEVLEAAGISKVRTVIVAIVDPKMTQAIVEFIVHHYPKITIIARAHNRNDYLALKAAGAHSVVRELFAGALEAATEALHALGYSDGQAMQKAETFKQHDESLLNKQAKALGDSEKVIKIGRQGREELEAIFQQDQRAATRS